MPFKNPEDRKRYITEYNKKFPEKQARRSKSWYEQNKEKSKASAVKWKKEHPEAAYKMIRKHTLKKYGLSLEDYEFMFADQNGVCAICLSPPLDRKLSVDHDHETGKVRGLLCDSCNTSLGGFLDSTETLERAINYLKKQR